MLVQRTSLVATTGEPGTRTACFDTKKKINQALEPCNDARRRRLVAGKKKKTVHELLQPHSIFGRWGTILQEQCGLAPFIPLSLPHLFTFYIPTFYIHSYTMDLPGRTESTISKGGKVPVTVFTGFVGVGKTVSALSPPFNFF